MGYSMGMCSRIQLETLPVARHSKSNDYRKHLLFENYIIKSMIQPVIYKCLKRLLPARKASSAGAVSLSDQVERFAGISTHSSCCSSLGKPAVQIIDNFRDILLSPCQPPDHQ